MMATKKDRVKIVMETLSVPMIPTTGQPEQSHIGCLVLPPLRPGILQSIIIVCSAMNALFFLLY